MLSSVYLVVELIAGLLGARHQRLPPHRISPLDGSVIALPTPQQLAFQDREIGFIIHFNIATFLTDDTQFDGCNNFRHVVPDINTFAPSSLSVDDWMESIAAVGAKTATLVAKHNCGFTTWPTRTTFPVRGSGRTHAYDYTIQNSPMSDVDLPAQFARAAGDVGIGHGFYYSLNFNNYLNVFEFSVDPDIEAGQMPITQGAYDRVVFDQLEELWSSYGSLTELWFDGGYVTSQVAHVRKLVERYQPDAVVFNGCDTKGTCITKHPVRWIGTEEGQAPEENWSTGLSNDGGDPTSPFFAPAECDTATYRDGRWFYGEHHAPRSLSDMVRIYHQTVGRNCFLELGLSPDRRGLVPPDHAKAYRELGAFIGACYGRPLRPREKVFGSDGRVHLTFGTPISVDRVVLMEDQTDGQVIRSYTIHGRGADGSEWRVLSKGTSVGHKKIDLFERDVMVTELMINSTHVDTPKWRDVSVFRCDRI